MSELWRVNTLSFGQRAAGFVNALSKPKLLSFQQLHCYEDAAATEQVFSDVSYINVEA